MERLDFDSDLFGVRVFRAEAMPDPSLLSGCDLLYLFNGETVPVRTLERYHGCLADQRWTYRLDLGKRAEHRSGNSSDFEIEVVREKHLTPDDREILHNLAFQSGYRCRFRMDPLMPLDWFHRMYRSWMDNSINGTAADRVLAVRVQDRYVAMITLRNQGGDAASIGLVSVDRSQTGKGMGRWLMHEAMDRCRTELGRSHCLADTHGQDPGACAFYEALGFRLVERTNVYHLWPNGPPST